MTTVSSHSAQNGCPVSNTGDSQTPSSVASPWGFRDALPVKLENWRPDSEAERIEGALAARELAAITASVVLTRELYERVLRALRVAGRVGVAVDPILSLVNLGEEVTHYAELARELARVGGGR